MFITYFFIQVMGAIALPTPMGMPLLHFILLAVNLLFQHAEVDSEGKVSLSQLTALLESSIYEKSDRKYNPVL